MSAIKFGESLSKFMIPITLLEKSLSLVTKIKDLMNNPGLPLPEVACQAAVSVTALLRWESRSASLSTSIHMLFFFKL